MKIIMPSDPVLRYQGRIGRKNPNAPEFYWSGSSVTFGFTGKYLSVCIENFKNYHISKLGYVLDGILYQFTLTSCTDAPEEYVIPVSEGGVHSFTLYKRQDDPHYFKLRGISIADDAEVITVPSDQKLKLEFYGDSVTSGAVCELNDYVGQLDPIPYDSVYDDAWQSYAMQTARLLNAEVHLVSQGGIALLDGTGYFAYGEYGMESVYDKLCYLPSAPCMTEWDFSLYQPDVVVFAIGQNDHHIGEDDVEELAADARKHWLSRYTAIIRDLMEKYPDARFVLMLTILCHSEYWEVLLDEACEMIGDARVMRFRFKRSGIGTPGHPRIAEHQEMACELSEWIHTKMNGHGDSAVR